MNKQQSPSPTPATANKSASVLVIQPLENVNKELLYHQRMNRPFKVIQNLPISKSSTESPDYSTLKHPLSVKDSAVLYNSLIVSRFNWIHHIFQTYWTRREQVIRGVDMNKKDKMVRFCNPVLFCGVHTFKIKLFFLKDDEREKAFRVEVEKRKEERLKRRQEKLEEMQRKREAKEREEKEKELEREKLKEAYLAKIHEDKKQAEQLQENQLLFSQHKLQLNPQQAQHIQGHEKQMPQPNLPQNRSSQLSTPPLIIQQQETSSQHPVAQALPAPRATLEHPGPQINSSLSTPTATAAISENPNRNQAQNKGLNEGNGDIPLASGQQSPPQVSEKLTIDNKKESFVKVPEPPSTKFIDSKGEADKKEKQETISTSATNSNKDQIGEGETNTKGRSKPDTKDIMSNPESAIMIQNLNVLAKQDPHLNILMKKVASGSASTEQILEFQKYIQKAKQMGDVTGYMAKLRQKQKEAKEAKTNTKTSKKTEVDPRSQDEIEREKQRKKKEKLARAQSTSIIKPVKLTPEEAKKREEDLMKRAMELKMEQERLRMEKQRLKEEKEREKLRLKQEKIEQKAKEREEKERLKQQAKKEREQEKERKRQEKLAAKERARLEREERHREKQLQREREKLEQKSKSKSDSIKRQSSFDEDEDENEEYDRMAKLNKGDDEEDDDLWNDKLSPLQERYNTGASLVFEFLENPSSRFVIPRDTIYELIDNEEEDNEEDNDNENENENSKKRESEKESRNEKKKESKDEKENGVKEENKLLNGEQDNNTGKVKTEGESVHTKSAFVTLLASFLLVHNQKEIDGWERRKAEAKAAEEEKERKRLEALKAEEEEASKNTIAENARKRRRKRSTWGTSNKRATRASKQAKEMQQLLREEENYHEEDELQSTTEVENVRPIPIYSCVTVKLSKVPFRFANFILESGNSIEERKKNMEETMKIGTRVPLSQLWYQIDGIKDELLGETLRYNLNRLDYAACGGKKSKTMFLKKFGRGGRG